jgi:transposase-like protein
MININFKSVRQLLKAFPNEQICVDHLEQLRWNGNVISPFDPASKVYKCAGNKYKCKNTGKYFNVRTFTLFDNTKIELQTWFVAIYLITGHKKGISSLQLSRDLNVTQKTAWFMLHRIRACYGLTEVTGNDNNKVGGEGEIVEIDETYVGGKYKNKHKSVRRKAHESNASHTDNKTGVMAMLHRDGLVRTTVITGNKTMKQLVEEKVSKGSIVFTDSATAYKGLDKEYTAHETVNHYDEEYVRGIIHTNSVEGFFSTLKRGIYGIYHQVSAKHLQKYCDEFAFRYNSRQISDNNRFNVLLSNSTNRLTYKNLTK